MIPRGFTTLLFGSGLAQVIAIAALPVLGRLYDPTSFGQLGAVLALVSLGAAVVHGRYQVAIPVADDDADARALLWLTCGLSVLFSLPLVLILTIVAGERPEAMSVGMFLATASLLTFLTAQIDIFSYWRSRVGRFGVTARNALVRNIVAVGLQIGFAMVSGLGLLAGVVLGAITAVALGWLDVIRRDGASARMPSIREIGKAARKFSHFAVFGVPQGWLAAFSWNAMPLLLLRFDSTATAGQYWVAYRLLLAPVTVFGSAYRQAILPHFSQLPDTQAQAVARLHSLFLAAAGLVPMLILFNYGEPIFEFIIGPKWGEAGVLAAFLSIGILADALKIPAICLLQYQGQQRSILIWEALIVVVRYAAAIPLLMAGETTTAVAAFAACGAVGWSLFSIVQLWPRHRRLADA